MMIPTYDGLVYFEEMMIPTYDGLVYFEDWLEAEGYYREIYDEEERERLYDEFCEWAEENGLIPEYC